MTFAFRKKSDGSITVVTDESTPLNKFQRNPEYQKLYEEAHIEVLFKMIINPTRFFRPICTIHENILPSKNLVGNGRQYITHPYFPFIAIGLCNINAPLFINPTYNFPFIAIGL